MLHGDYLGPHLLVVFLDTVHVVNVGHFSRCVPLLLVDLNDACLFCVVCFPQVGAKHASRAVSLMDATWLILPVVICLSQRLSHACVSMN